jgi:hypothetical protein
LEGLEGLEGSKLPKHPKLSKLLSSTLELKLQTRTILTSNFPNLPNLPNLLNLPNQFRGRAAGAKLRGLKRTLREVKKGCPLGCYVSRQVRKVHKVVMTLLLEE